MQVCAVPPITTPLKGSNVVLDDRAERLAQVRVLSASEMVTAMLLTAVSSSVD